MVIAPGRDRFDLAHPDSLGALVDDLQPQVIVNAAAYTAVDQAEAEPALAGWINAYAPEVLAAAARKHDALLVHYSTDYVFDGAKSGAYLESDAPAPLNVYGASKLAGEQAICTSGCDYLIFRTSWVYSSRGKNFLRTVLRLAGEREKLQIVDDQTGAPTWSRLIAETTALVLQQNIAMRRLCAFESALLNLTAAGATSWHGFAAAIVAAARDRGMPLKCLEVLPIPTAGYPLPARRPANSRMSCRMLELRYGLKMPAWESQLQLVMNEVGGEIKPLQVAELMAAHDTRH
jgi:dTDP-4-dehydrorhamnose reductase